MKQINMNFHTYLGYQNFTKIFTKRYIAGSMNCSTKPISLLLTELISAVKTDMFRHIL